MNFYKIIISENKSKETKKTTQILELIWIKYGVRHADLGFFCFR